MTELQEIIRILKKNTLYTGGSFLVAIVAIVIAIFAILK